jgi:hypothetical protein
MSAWKAAERRIARRFGAERNPLSGSNSGVSASDSRHPYIFIETKQGKQCIPLNNLYKKTSALAAKERKLPLVCYQPKNCKGFLVIVHIDDLEALCGELIPALQERTPVPCSYSPLSKKKAKSSPKRQTARSASASSALKDGGTRARCK